MSKEKIKKIAIKHFNQYGYEGTKMAQIAEDAGMRKQSLSYHYSTKKDLFFELYKEVIEEEQAFINHYFEVHVEELLEVQLYNLLTEHKNRFLTNPNVTFLYMFSFFSPLEAYEFISSQYGIYLGTLKEAINACFAKHTFRRSSEECTIAFVTLLDGLDIQLVYVPNHMYEKVQQITWDIFWNGIQMK
ncbi:TetR/AcrR family transcriptional regulator [Peribacillus loiseleuriae]|uniref:TetR family transcriptional regulator n=1 Tax=Peribacillus loiseleuriae TaxID=1679170 RepID=A0A0K9GWB0_9BACI|nr:TetR/AcrR family transcriptional regulator [Peribacillus loiseleuriae]KMY50940.1 TetR family transcriptional regulator [Peribacillus loiseleuriae]